MLRESRPGGGTPWHVRAHGYRMRMEGAEEEAYSACASALMRGPASGVPVESADNSHAIRSEFAIFKAVKRTCISGLSLLKRDMHTVPVYETNSGPCGLSRKSPLIACHASLIHHSVIPRLGLSVISVSHMT